MKKAMSGVFAAAFAAVAVAGPFASAQARPLTPAEQRHQPYSGSLPFCDNPTVLGKLHARFVERERDYWNSGLIIVGWQRVQEIGYRANGVDYIPRRFCKALAYMNDQKVREVSYQVGEGLGPIGIGWDIEWCMTGLDRNYAYGLDCRGARP